MIEIPRPQTQEERYKKIKMLGQGAMGKVYLVQCMQDSKQYVVKRIKTEHLQQKQRQALEKQAYLLQLLDHKNIVKFKQVYTTKKHKLCIVMEYAQGGDLDKKIQQQQGKHFEQKQILKWLAQIASALRYIHQKKIIHRDIKGGNVFLSQDNSCKLGDFGISKIMNKTMQTHKSFVGTPSYLSPQMVEGRAYGTKADIWALGVILYQLCALKLPFEANSLPVLALRIIRGQFSPLPKNLYSKQLQQLILSLLKVDPKKRPSALQILKNPLLKSYVHQSFPDKIPLVTKTIKVTNLNKQFQKETKSPPKINNNDKREALRKQMKQDLKKKRLQNKSTTGQLKIKKIQPKLQQSQQILPKIDVKPWKLNNKNKTTEIPIQILLPNKKQFKQQQPFEDNISSDFVVQIKMSEKTKQRLQKIENKKQFHKTMDVKRNEQSDHEQQVVEQDIEQSIQHENDDLQDVRNAIQNINLKFGDLKLPEKIILNQYEDSLDNFETVLSDKHIKEASEQDQCLNYITKNCSNSNTAEQLRILLESKLGYQKFLQTYKTLKQYTQNLVKSNKQLEFDKQRLRSLLGFLSRQQFDSNLYQLYTLLVLENEQISANFDNTD